MKKLCEKCGINYTKRSIDHLCSECIKKLTSPRPCKCGCGEIVTSKDWRVCLYTLDNRIFDYNFNNEYFRIYNCGYFIIKNTE